MSDNVFSFRRSVKHHQQLVNLFGEATVLRSRDLEQTGFTRSHIKQAVTDGTLERIDYGLYSLPGASVTEHHSLVRVARRVPDAVFCLLSALRFHDLSTQNPHEVWIFIGAKDRKPVMSDPPLRIFRENSTHAELGVEEHMVEGMRLKVCSVARTVVDLFRYRNKIGIDVALEVLKDGWRERRFSLPEINRIAQEYRMSNVMKPYLESLVA